MAPSDKTPLQFSTQGKGRILVGLSWDPRPDKIGFIDQVVRKDSQHDMDLTCFLYNAESEFVDYVGAEAQDSMDQSGKVYHSGDDMSGEGGGDDETITAELNALPADIHALVFLAEVKSRHVLGDVDRPSARLLDSLTGDILLETYLAENADDKSKIACILWAISRDPASHTGWSLSAIRTCPDLADISEWGPYLARYLA